MINYSIVIPVYNEEDSLRPLLEELVPTMEFLKKTYEIVFVNDGSSDSSPMILKEFQTRYPEIAKVITLSNRSGQTTAMRRGLQEAQGNIVVTLDADLQNDPADIPYLIMKLQGEFDVICGWRRDRRDKPLKAFFSKLGNVLQRLFTGLKVHDVSCTLRAYKRKCVADIPLSWEGQHRFIPLSLSLQGYRVGEILSHHRERSYGFSKYSHRRIFKVVLDFFRVVLTRGKT
jgi:glycosyltransferase involved in cell wall biosynthesis